MAISALPDSAVRHLGATQAITDPASVVKELIDNALDARATNISVEISANTVDVVQVRDNGHGVPPQDRLLVARPHCTSKIRDTEDLRSVGARSLGFRGEALASMAQLAAGLTIGTRVEGEPVATNLNINKSGEVTSQDRVSLATGTSVRLTDLLHASPVRRQQALKGADKCLKKIRLTLQSYAFARPHVRLSLRVLKTKQDNWIYAAKSDSTSEEVTAKLCGAACASQCVWSEIEHAGYILQAYAPRVDADLTKVSGIGAFLSVDSRPVSTARGILRQIVKLYRDALKTVNSSVAGASEPFLYLQITCPTASYDANVEPSKDDVLFDDPNMVLAAASRLFDAIYSPSRKMINAEGHVGCTSRPPTTRHDQVDEVGSMPFQGRDEGLVRATSASVTAIRPEDQEDVLNPGEEDAQETDLRRAFRTNMFGGEDETGDVAGTGTLDQGPCDDFEELRRARKDVNIFNPWVVSKMNALQRRPVEDRTSDSAEVGEPEVQGLGSSQSHNNCSTLGIEQAVMPTPAASSPSRPARLSHRPDEVAHATMAQDGRTIGSHSLPPPMQLTPMSSPVKLSRPKQSGSSSPARAMPDFTNISLDARTDAIAPGDAGARRSKVTKQMKVNKPFKSPVQLDPERGKVWFDHVERMNIAYSSPTKKRGRDVAHDHDLVGQRTSDGVRPPAKPTYNRDMRHYLRPQVAQQWTPEPSTSDSLHQEATRHSTQIGVIDSSSSAIDENTAPLPNESAGTSAGVPCGVEAHVPKRREPKRRHLRKISANSDPRDEPTRDQSQPDGVRAITASGRTRSLPRSKSSMLPLERVPAGQGMHNVRVQKMANTSDIARAASLLGRDVSMSFRAGADLVAAGSSLRACKPAHVRELALKLQSVLTSILPAGELTQDLHQLMQAAFSSHQMLFGDGDSKRTHA